MNENTNREATHLFPKSVVLGSSESNTAQLGDTNEAEVMLALGSALLPSSEESLILRVALKHTNDASRIQVRNVAQCSARLLIG